MPLRRLLRRRKQRRPRRRPKLGFDLLEPRLLLAADLPELLPDAETEEPLLPSLELLSEQGDLSALAPAAAPAEVTPPANLGPKVQVPNTFIWDDPQLNDIDSYTIKVEITDGTATVKRKVKFKLISSFLTF